MSTVGTCHYCGRAVEDIDALWPGDGTVIHEECPDWDDGDDGTDREVD